MSQSCCLLPCFDGAVCHMYPHETLKHLRSRAEVATALVASGCDVDAPDARGYTPLHLAAAAGQLAMARALVEAGKVALHIGQLKGLKAGADNKLSHVLVQSQGAEAPDALPADVLLPFFGLTMKLGPIADFGLNLEENLIPVDTERFETSTPSIFAIGDINHYPGKLKLILSGFHEAALMAHAAHGIVHPEKKIRFQYTTSSSSLQQKLGVA